MVDELQFKPSYNLRKRVNSKGDVRWVREPHKGAVMTYHQWTDEVCINSYHNAQRVIDRYPFAIEMFEDNIAATLTHESIHKALRSIGGWGVSKKFDRICQWWALRYWMDPP